jgi:hypothetical protein
MKAIKSFFNWIKSFFCKRKKNQGTPVSLGYNGIYYNIGGTIGGGKL